MVSVTGSTSQIIVVQAVNLCDVYSSITTRQDIIIYIHAKNIQSSNMDEKTNNPRFSWSWHPYPLILCCAHWPSWSVGFSRPLYI